MYLAGRSLESQITWLDRNGKELGKVGPRADQSGVVLSPDGNTVAVTRRSPNGLASHWLYDLVRGSESRLTPPGFSRGGAAVWSPDSSRIWFGMTGPDGPGMYQKDLKGGELQLVQKTDPAAPRAPSDLSRDGQFLIYTENNPRTQADIWYVPVESGKLSEKAVKLLGTDAIESQGQLSPDGKWLAYDSNDVWKVSVDGGREPRWRSDGKELYFNNSLRPLRVALMAATVEVDGAALRIGLPQKLFEARASTFVPQINIFAYSPHPDGQRFLVNALAETGEAIVNVITNWHRAVAEEGGRR